MPTRIDQSYGIKPLVVCLYGKTGVGKTSYAIMKNAVFGSVYLADSEKQSHLNTGPGYIPFVMDRVESASDVVYHIGEIRKSPAKYGNPKCLVIDTVTLLKDIGEDAVYESKLKSKKEVQFTQADWMKAKRPSKHLLLNVQRSSDLFDFVFLIARAKAEYAGTGFDSKPTGRDTPDVIKGFDFSAHVILEITEDHMIVVRKPKPALEKWFPYGKKMSFDNSYKAFAEASRTLTETPDMADIPRATDKQIGEFTEVFMKLSDDEIRKHNITNLLEEYPDPNDIPAERISKGIEFIRQILTPKKI